MKIITGRGGGIRGGGGSADASFRGGGGDGGGGYSLRGGGYYSLSPHHPGPASLGHSYPHHQQGGSVGSMSRAASNASLASMTLTPPPVAACAMPICLICLEVLTPVSADIKCMGGEH